MIESLLKSVILEREKYGTPLKNAEMGELLNAVAYKHRADGWGLASKAQGAHTLLPGTRQHISRDLLIHKPSATMYDVLSDVAGEARPAWQGPERQDMSFVYPTMPPAKGGVDDTEGGGGGEMGRLSPLTVYVDLEALAAALIKGSQ